jgi:16S rRNA (cytosine967-C5)-methyltransferase
VVRRHPDIAWLRRQSDLAQTTQSQREILDALWQTLAPGGLLLLVTCSVFPEEGEHQAQALLTRHADAQRLEAPGQTWPIKSTTCLAGQDGFFYALFQRRPLSIGNP